MPEEVLDSVASTARVIDGVFVGHNSTSLDRDHVGVELKAGVTYTIRALGEADEEGTLEFPAIFDIKTAEGVSLGEPVDLTEGIGDYTFEFTPQSDGLYFLQISTYGEESGSYKIRVTQDQIGGNSDDSFTGTSDEDSLDGAGGNDILDGGASNDILVAGGGDDTLTGGTGADTFVFYIDNYEVFPGLGPETTDIFGTNVVTDFTPGTDTIWFRGSLIRRFEDLNITQDGDDAVINFDWGDSVRLTGVNAEDLTEDDFIFRRGVRLARETQEATPGDDSLIGTAGADTLAGFDGNDTLFGGDGIDYLRGFDGNDVLSGGTGNDVIGGEDGEDLINGDEGDDFMIAGRGNDTVFGGLGDDLLQGDLGDDLLDGGAGNDTLRAGRGDDTLTGGSGSDMFTVGRSSGTETITDFVVGHDILDLRGTGEDYEDFTISQDGNDAVVSGAFGTVILQDVDASALESEGESAILGAGAVTSLYTEYQSTEVEGLPTSGLAAETGVVADNGSRWADIDGEKPTISFSFPGYDSRVETMGNPDNGWFYALEPLTPLAQFYAEQTFREVAAYTNIKFAWVEDYEESGANIRLAFHQFVVGGASSTPYEGPYSAEVFIGVEVGDWFAKGFIVHELGHSLGLADLPNWSPVTGEDYTIMSYIKSARYQDAVWSDPSVDEFMAADIEALQYLYGVNETATAGNDVFTFDAGGSYIETIFDAGGTDSIVITGTGDAVKINLEGGNWSNIGQDIVYSGHDEFRIEEPGTVFIMEGVMIENVTAADGDDTVLGNAADNVLRGNAGNDALMGYEGADRLVGGLGADTVMGGDGNDTLFAGGGDDGDDMTAGESGDDIIGGGAGDDTLIGDMYGDNAGTAGSDTIFGGSGNDLIVADGFDDANNNGVVDGGELNQSSNFNVAYGGDGSDSLYGGNGNDTVGGGLGSDVITAAAGNDIVYGGKTGDESIMGGEGNDTIFASSDNDTVSGGSGSDVAFGGSGNDILAGDAGNDTIYGGAGDDVIRGGSGSDALFGGGGSDRFVFGDDSGTDQITGFEADLDTLDLSELTNRFGDRSALISASEETNQGGDTGILITLSDTDGIFLSGLSLSDLEIVSLTL